MLPSLSEHQMLVLWTELAALLLAARLLGGVARRVGQPTVLGELLAGLLLGPSVFGYVWPSGFQWFLPGGPASTPLLTVAAISLLPLLVVIGAETDLRLIRRLGTQAAAVSVGSLALPLAAGAALAVVLPPVMVGAHGGRAAFIILIAAAMAASSLPVIAKIVRELGLIRRDVGQLAIAAGTTNDAVGFLLLALVTGLVSSDGGSSSHLPVALGGLLVITLATLTIGQRVLDVLLRRARRHGPNVVGSLAISLIGALAAAAAMQAVGVEGALGAFLAGMALGRSRYQQGRALSLLDTMTTAVFSPLYFATAGLRVDLSALSRSDMAISFALVVGVAAASKLAGTIVGGRAARLHWREAAALGVVLNGRGAMQVIIATAGLGAGVLTTSSYTVVILLSIVTSIAVPPALRAVIRDWPGSSAEQERLDREHQLGRNVIVRGQRLLLPSRGSPNSILAAEILGAAWPDESEVTILSVGANGDERASALDPVADALRPRAIEHRHVPSDQVLDEILAEANLGYGIIAVSAAQEPSRAHLLSLVVDDLLIRSPIPLLVVRRAWGVEHPRPAALNRILVPVTGTASSRAGQEVACNLGRGLGIPVTLAHVVTRSDVDVERVVAPGAERLDGDKLAAPGQRVLPEAEGAAQVVLRGAWSMAVEMGIQPDVVIRHGRSAGEEIIKAIEETNADAVALGTTVRQVGEHPFLGHTVEQVLTQTNATVMVVALPETSSRLGALVAEATGHT